MHENDSIDDMLTKFTKITNGFASLGNVIDNDQKGEEGHLCSTTIMGGQGYNIKRAK